VIILNGVLGFFQEYRAECAVAAFKRLLPPTATVIRGGEERQIPADALVPGDVLVLHEGDRISADGRLVQADDLRTDDSSLTGEAHPVHKTERAESESERSLVHARNMVFASSTVTSGSGIAVVSATSPASGDGTGG
jgi:Ca2+-transporting ATPase